jgi:alpha-glucosidase (family GH31 glycosyl hydrolase)
VTFNSNHTSVLLESADEIWHYVISHSPFRVSLFVNGILTTILNQRDSLRYASESHRTYKVQHDKVVEGSEIALGFTLSTEHVYGLPHRASKSFVLQQPAQYRLFNQDKYEKHFGSNEPLYSSWPYVTGHASNLDVSVVWMNSAETFVNIEKAAY